MNQAGLPPRSPSDAPPPNPIPTPTSPSPKPRRLGPAPLGRWASLLTLATSTLVPTPLPAAHWTHYRGPYHNGTYDGPFRTDWNVTRPTLLWRKAASPALSSISVANGRAFTQGRRRVAGEDREFAIGLDAATGNELWATNLDLADYPNGGVGNDDGPRSTPVVDGDRVFVFTTYLKLYCLEAATGRQIWKRDFPAELGSTVINWQNAASPLVLGDFVYLNVNHNSGALAALHKRNGDIAWRKHSERMTQATPVAATIAGVHQIVFFTQSGLVSIRPDTGDALWRFSLPYSTSTAASPVVDGDLVYASAAYSSGSGVARIATTGNSQTASQLWKRRSFNMNHWATGVAHQGHLYSVAGQDNTSLRCIDTAAGVETWRTDLVGSGTIGYGSVLKAGDTLLALTADGEAVLVALDPQAYRELQHFKVVNGKTWNSPALDDGVLYARSTTEIAVWRIANAAPSSPLQLTPNLSLTDGKATVVVRSEDGTPLASDRAARVSLLATDQADTPATDWLTLPLTPRWVDGQLLFEDPTPPSPRPTRFYRASEKP